jgi:hypothetical protein
MKGTKYPIVNSLPEGAKSVTNYSEEYDISIAYVYIKHTRGKADYDIVNFQGINFIVPIQESKEA